MINRGTSKVSKIFKGTNKTKYIYRGTTKVWSGASVVSYYDGSTLLGTEEVDEGEDVLRPSISTSKSEYTLFGWSTTNGGERVNVLGATGEPMSLYAIYVPNTLQALVATFNGGTYTVTLKNAQYITGNTIARASRDAYYSGGGSTSDSQSFNINLGAYQKATVYGRGGSGGRGDTSNEQAYYDGSSVYESYFTREHTASGSHSLYAYGEVAGGNNAVDAWALVLSITLSNPAAWV